MPSKFNLVTFLAGAHRAGKDRAFIVAGHLVTSAIKGRSNDPKIKKENLVKESGERLWNSYWQKRLDESITAKEAAQDAILDEQYALEEEVKKA